MRTSESIASLSAALAKAQSEIENASKNAANPHFRSRYADLAEILNTVRPVLSANGLSVIQSPSYADGVASVTTRMMHSSGEWVESTASAPVSKPDAQGIGSATTYLRRYALAGFAGIAQEDDDANAASEPKEKTATKQQSKPSNLTIGDAEFAELNRLLDESGSDKAAFCEHFGIASVAALPMAKYAAAIAAIKRKMETKQ